MDLAERLQARNIPQLQAERIRQEPPPQPGFQPVTVVHEPVKLTRKIVLTMVGVSTVVSLLINGLVILLG